MCLGAETMRLRPSASLWWVQCWTRSHVGVVTAIENQETLPWGVSSHQILPAGLPDANSMGGEWIMPMEWINLLADTQPWMLCDGSFYRGRWSDLREGSGERYQCKLSWWSFYFNLLNALPEFSTVDSNVSKAECHQMFCNFNVFDKHVT